MKEQQHKRIIISGGGTGGHIFPALSIASALKEIDPGTEILFVGALGRMEMEKVPAAGYEIIGLPVEGLQRKLTFGNLRVLRNLLRSLRLAKKILKDFKPDVVVGVGGYASGPVLRKAASAGIPTLLQEQNSYAGLTNRLLAKKAASICVAYEKMDRYFPVEKIVFTGNPVRSDIVNNSSEREKALLHFGLKDDKKIILVLGGSLGSATINESILGGLEALSKKGYQLVWQTGRYYFDKMRHASAQLANEDIKVMGFIDRMDMAYSVADVIVSRAGAGTISELCIAARPVVLVPSPNVAEDHQTKNALALKEKNAALMISDADAPQKLIPGLIAVMEDNKGSRELIKNIKLLAIHDSDNRIAKEVLKLAR